MYENLRAQIAARIAAQQAVVAQRQAALRAAQDAAVVATSAVTSAQAAVTQALQAHETAKTAVVNAQRRVDDARRDRNAAAQAVADWKRVEPANNPNKPNQRWEKWSEEMGNRQAALSAADGALRSAESALNAAVAQRATAAANVAAKQSTLAQARANLLAAQATVVAATSAVTDAQTALAALHAELKILDARQARILAQPLNADDVSIAADAELAAAWPLRRQRLALRRHRVGVVSDRGYRLSVHDAMVDDLAVMAATIRGAPGAGLFPDLAGIAAALEAIVAAARVQQALPPAQRTDDLRAAAAALDDLYRRMDRLAGDAVRNRDAKIAALNEAARTLRDVNQDAPAR